MGICKKNVAMLSTSTQTSSSTLGTTVKRRKPFSDVNTTSTTMTLANASTTTKPEVTCDDSWELRPDSSDCYKAIGHQLDWQETQEVCQMFGGNLASIHDSVENDFVLKFAWAFTNQPIWIGYSNKCTTMTWILPGSTVQVSHMKTGIMTTKNQETHAALTAVSKWILSENGLVLIGEFFFKNAIIILYSHLNLISATSNGNCLMNLSMFPR